jgi:hypothetical protein
MTDRDGKSVTAGPGMRRSAHAPRDRRVSSPLIAGITLATGQSPRHHGGYEMRTLATCIAATLIGLSTGVSWAQKSARPTDPQIAAIVDTANQVDIDAGKLAKSMSRSKDVQEFAQLMIKTTAASTRPPQTSRPSCT